MISHVWVFSGLPTSSQRSAFIRQIEELRVTDVALMINPLTSASFTLSVDRVRQIEEVCWDLEEIAVYSHLVSWLRPSRAYLETAATRLRPLCLSTGVRSLMFDVEEPWTRHVAGEAAARSILSRYWRFQDWPCPLGATVITPRLREVRPVAELCDYVLPQAYSTSGTSTTKRPGVTQRLAHENWSVLGKPLVMGLAAWKLNLHGGLTQAGSMQTAITAVEDLRDPAVQEVAYWSYRWLLQSATRRDFVRQASLKARAGLSQRAALPAGPGELEETRAA